MGRCMEACSTKYAERMVPWSRRPPSLQPAGFHRLPQSRSCSNERSDSAGSWGSCRHREEGTSCSSGRRAAELVGSSSAWGRCSLHATSVFQERVPPSRCCAARRRVGGSRGRAPTCSIRPLSAARPAPGPSSMSPGNWCLLASAASIARSVTWVVRSRWRSKERDSKTSRRDSRWPIRCLGSFASWYAFVASELDEGTLAFAQPRSME